MIANLVQKVEALESDLETATQQRDELIDLLDELLSGAFMRLHKWTEEAAETVDRMKRSRQ